MKVEKYGKWRKSVNDVIVYLFIYIFIYIVIVQLLPPRMAGRSAT
jgi:hypothetical protein